MEADEWRAREIAKDIAKCKVLILKLHILTNYLRNTGLEFHPVLEKVEVALCVGLYCLGLNTCENFSIISPKTLKEKEMEKENNK